MDPKGTYQKNHLLGQHCCAQDLYHFFQKTYQAEAAIACANSEGSTIFEGTWRYNNT
jgi:hypothetical protein